MEKFLENPIYSSCIGFIFVSSIMLMFLIDVYFWIISFFWCPVMGKVVEKYRAESELDEYIDAKIVYEYAVNGVFYRSSRISYLKVLGPMLPGWYNRYDVGMDVTVYYNPNKPKQSVLSKKFPLVSFMVYLFCIFVFIYLQVKLCVLCGWTEFFMGVFNL